MNVLVLKLGDVLIVVMIVVLAVMWLLLEVKITFTRTGFILL